MSASQKAAQKKKTSKTAYAWIGFGNMCTLMETS